MGNLNGVTVFGFTGNLPINVALWSKKCSFIIPDKWVIRQFIIFIVILFKTIIPLNVLLFVLLKYYKY